MKPEIKEFIKQHIELIDSNRWEEFYNIVGEQSGALRRKETLFSNENEIGEMTQFLITCGCDPLSYMKKVPECYLAGSSFSEIIIPANIKSIGYDAFSEMWNVTSIHIPQTVEELHLCCFGYNYNVSFVQIFNKDIRIHEDAFMECYRIRKIDFAGTVLEWREKNLIFYDCVVDCLDGQVIYDKAGGFA